MTEAWRDIPDFPGYQASDCGRIRSLDRVVMGLRRGRIVPIKRKGRLLKLKQHKATGYQGVELSGRDQLVHRLVLAAFHGPCPQGMEAAHGDGVRSHNALSNLRYATRTENAADRRRHGTLLRGEGIGNSKLTAADVAEIRALRGQLSSYALAARFNVTRQQISHIHHGRVWADGFDVHEERRVA